MRPLWPERIALAHARGAIDRVDDGLIVLLAARRRLVRLIAALKPRLGVPPRDRGREREVYVRAQRLAARVDVPAATVCQLMNLVIGDACRQQGVLVCEEPVEGDQGADGNAPSGLVPLHRHDER